MTAENKENITDKSAASETAPAAPTTETADNGISDNVISIEDFFKVQLKVGQILTAEPVEKSKKLLKLTLWLIWWNLYRWPNFAQPSISF